MLDESHAWLEQVLCNVGGWTLTCPTHPSLVQAVPLPRFCSKPAANGFAPLERLPTPASSLLSPLQSSAMYHHLREHFQIHCITSTTPWVALQGTQGCPCARQGQKLDESSGPCRVRAACYSMLLHVCRPRPMLSKAVSMQGGQKQSVLESAPRQRHPEIDEDPAQP